MKKAIIPIQEEQIKEFYSRQENQFEIIKQSKNREFAFIRYLDKPPKLTIRNMRVNSTQHLNNWFLSANFNKNYFNCYISVARFKGGVPYFKNGMDLRTREIYNYMDTVEYYDFVVDIDVKSHKQFNAVKESAITIHNFFMKRKIAHEIRFTGRGFNIIVKHENTGFSKINSLHKFKQIRQAYLSIAIYLQKELCELIDLQIYDERRVTKCPYTLAIYPKGIYMCTPLLSQQQLRNCKLSDFSLNTRLKKFMRNRGTFTFCDDINAEIHFQKLINDVNEH